MLQGGKHCSQSDFVVRSYGKVIKNSPENESFPGRACFHPIPPKVEVLAFFQHDCTLLTNPENNAGFGGETGTKIFTCFPSLIHFYIYM